MLHTIYVSDSMHEVGVKSQLRVWFLMKTKKMSNQKHMNCKLYATRMSKLDFNTTVE